MKNSKTTTATLLAVIASALLLTTASADPLPRLNVDPLPRLTLPATKFDRDAIKDRLAVLSKNLTAIGIRIKNGETGMVGELDTIEQQVDKILAGILDGK